MPFTQLIHDQLLDDSTVAGAVTNVDDPNSHPEDFIQLPWCIDPVVSWLQYDCYIQVLLDPGTVLHKALPQQVQKVDTLGVIDISDTALAAGTGGINLYSNSQATDIIQQMATSTYTFVLKGEAYRAGYQIPIPNLVSVADVPCVPTYPQFAVPLLQGNLLGGIPLWYAAWELHYLVTRAPRSKTFILAAPNPAAGIRPDAQLPTSVTVPRAPADQRATLAPPPKVQNFASRPGT